MQTIKVNLDDKKHLASLAKALSVETRVEMLRQLRYRDVNINEMAEILGIPPSSAAAHVKVLEEAGFISTSLQPGVRGSMKVCHIVLDHIYVELKTAMNMEQDAEIIRMPIGSYVDNKVVPTCGIVGAKGPIGAEDEPRSFYNPNRFEAQLLWFQTGYVEYRFPNDALKGRKGKKLELSMELCSEDHEYNLNCESDITFWINDLEVGTWTCPSDFGGRRGVHNPDWWPDKNTQYGILKTCILTEKGTFLDQEKMSNHKIAEYHLDQDEFISVRIGIKEDAKHVGGVNLFGEGFGDYKQNIIMKLSFA